MRGIKIPRQDFPLKMQGGLCARGGVFAGHSVHGTGRAALPLRSCIIRNANRRTKKGRPGNGASRMLPTYNVTMLH